MSTLGRKRTQRARLIDKDPAPLLLIHGSDDTEVHPHQARNTAVGLAFGGATYERIEIESGTHEISDPKARARMLEKVEKFLAAQLMTAK